MHPAQVIFETQSKPMTKQPVRIESFDDRMTGNMLANEVLAHAKVDQGRWLAFAWRCIDMTTEARAVFVNAIKAAKGEMTKAQNEAGIDEKASKKRTASFSTQVSMLTQVANAWNSGATLEGLTAYANAGFNDASKHAIVDHIRDHVSFTLLVEYARTYSQAKAGRKADTLLVKLGKFIEAQRKLEQNPDDAALMAELVAFYNSKVPA